MVVLVFFGIIFLVLLGTVIAFIRAFINSKEFRNDLLANGGENEISIGPLSAKGVLFLGLLALFLGAIIYMFTQFLEHSGSSSDQETLTVNDALLTRNKELADKKINLENRILDLENEIESYKLDHIKQSAIMDIYKNTRLLAYSTETDKQKKPPDNLISIISSRLGTLSELSSTQGVDLTPYFSKQCNQRTNCSLTEDFWAKGGNKPTELIVEYMCSGEYKMYRTSIIGINSNTVELTCKST